MSISNSIVEAYSNIDRIHSIEKEREETESLIEFQQWCKSMNIGSRVERRDDRAAELMAQYSEYPKWVRSKY
jgi:hypothetical protein